MKVKRTERIDPHAPSGRQITMKTEFNIINFRETIMVYPFSFSFFKSSPFIFVFLGVIRGGEAPIIAVFRIAPHAASQHQMKMKTEFSLGGREKKRSWIPD